MGYAKLFSSITESSLWSEPIETRVLFVSMLAKADATGFLESSDDGLARLANITIEDARKALKTLLSADPHSGDLTDFPANQGKRLLRVPHGFMIVNYEIYRDKQSEEDRRAYMRRYMQEYRQKEKATRKKPVNDGKQS